MTTNPYSHHNSKSGRLGADLRIPTADDDLTDHDFMYDPNSNLDLTMITNSCCLNNSRSGRSDADLRRSTVDDLADLVDQTDNGYKYDSDSDMNLERTKLVDDCALLSSTTSLSSTLKTSDSLGGHPTLGIFRSSAINMSRPPTGSSTSTMSAPLGGHPTLGTFHPSAINRSRQTRGNSTLGIEYVEYGEVRDAKTCLLAYLEVNVDDLTQEVSECNMRSEKWDKDLLIQRVSSILRGLQPA